MIDEYERLMRVALEQARLSLREGNSGFGAVVAADGEVVAACHDRDETDGDPTAHAELLAIRLAARRLGRDLSGCVLVATSEPCPMCTTATVWSGIREVAFGFSIEDAIAEGRRRIRLGAAEVFARAGVEASITPGVLRDECALLYRRDVRAEVRRLRNAVTDDLRAAGDELAERRRAWVATRPELATKAAADPLRTGYDALLAKLGVSPEQAPIVERTATRLVFESANFCPTLEACRLLDLDTRVVCRALTESATNALVRAIDPRLGFGRNYDRLRPHAAVCEEWISFDPEIQAEG